MYKVIWREGEEHRKSRVCIRSWERAKAVAAEFARELTSEAIGLSTRLDDYRFTMKARKDGYTVTHYHDVVEKDGKIVSSTIHMESIIIHWKRLEE